MRITSFLIAITLSVTQVTCNFDVMETIKKSFADLKQKGVYQRQVLRDTLVGAPQDCKDGKVTLNAEEFGCDNVNFLSFLGFDELSVPFTPHDFEVGQRSSDIWGWKSPTGREFTLLSLDNGVVIIDSTDPVYPCVVAKMPTRRPADVWGDVKVHDNTLYHVKDTNYFRSEGFSFEPESSSNYGIEVYDLLALDQLSCKVDNYRPLNIWPTYVYTDHGRCHNLVVNTDTAMLYSVGTEKCNGGFLALDLTDRLRPVEVACVKEDNYTHDGQCLTYDGPDRRYTGHEICFGFNEDTVTIWDFTDIRSGEYTLVSKTGYFNQAFTHQGWVNNDLTKVLMDDELDEICNNGNPTGSRRCEATSTGLSGHKTTSTYVFDITDLENPTFDGFFDHEDPAVDHNLYVWGEIHRKGWGGNPPMQNYPDPNYAYMNNYFSGLKIVNIGDEDYKNWKTSGSFDISPEIEAVAFGGAWSGYMHPSGVYAISSIERGLFLLYPEMAFTEEYPKGDE